MGIDEIGAFIRLLEAVASINDLADAIAEISCDLGFQYFALTHHVDVTRAAGTPIRLHNYPDAWATYYDNNALGVSDPGSSCKSCDQRRLSLVADAGHDPSDRR